MFSVEKVERQWITVPLVDIGEGVNGEKFASIPVNKIEGIMNSRVQDGIVVILTANNAFETSATLDAVMEAIIGDKE